MYDMTVANFLSGSSVILTDDVLENTNISVGFSHIESDNQVCKYYMIRSFPMFLQASILDSIRTRCIGPGVKINFYMYSEPHTIHWESTEMKNQMDVWRRVIEQDKNRQNQSIFDYRSNRGVNIVKERILQSTMYFNKAELDHKRTLCRVCFIVEFAARKDDESLSNLTDAIVKFRAICATQEIKFKELRINMPDWISRINPFCMRKIPEVNKFMSYRILTDDVFANFNSYKQGRVGYEGVSLGIDVLSKVPVMKKVKGDPDAAENWLISAESGGGKSYYAKTLLTYLLADNFVVTVMDYEGDEYDNLAAYIKESNPEDVKIVSMGKGSTIYFDPMEISDLTGDHDIDVELKETAESYTMAIFRVICCGLEGQMSLWEESVVSEAIRRVYDDAGVTDNPSTWKKSKGLRVQMVYDIMKDMVESKDFIDEDNDNVKHKAAIKLVETASIYFEEGGAKAGTFKNPMSVNSLYRAKFIIFSFGMRGATASQTDPTILALKQLSVANVSIQISNYCKYIRHCFNVKVWEEFQRYGEIKGSAEVITNAMTGGRKRGDVNILITNDLQAILDEDNPVAVRLSQNFTTMVVGRIRNKDVRERFCRKFDKPEMIEPLERIAKAYNSDNNVGGIVAKTNSTNKYRNAFCLLLDNGKQAIVKVMLPKALRESKLFKTGVDVDADKKK